MSIFPGFNTNIRHKNKIFHIQTEVLSKENSNTINTLVYLEGQIFYSINNELAQSESLHRETAALAIKKQHKEAIKDLISDQLQNDKESENISIEGSINFSELYNSDELFSFSNKKTTQIKTTIKKLLIESS